MNILLVHAADEGTSTLHNRIVYVVDDDRVVRDSMMFFLPTADYSPQAFASGAEFLAAMPQLVPGCVVLDARMNGIDGFDVIAALAPRRAQFPVVMVTGHGDVATAVRAMKLGASDFVEKPFEEPVLCSILERLFSGVDEAYRDEDRHAGAVRRLARLTMREDNVLRGLIAGQSNKALAYDLGLSVRTVEMHRAHMMERLDVTTLAEALRLAFDGWIGPDESHVQMGVRE